MWREKKLMKENYEYFKENGQLKHSHPRLCMAKSCYVFEHERTGALGRNLKHLLFKIWTSQKVLCQEEDSCFT
jgi:hypothetical protein